MTEGPVERPVLWGRLGEPVSFRPVGGGGAKVALPTRAAQGERLGGRFTELDDAFSEQASLTASLGASDPQLVVVFEAIDEREDLTAAAARAGLEVLTETERDFDPDSTFPRNTANQDLPVGGCLHAVCVSEQAKANVLRQWRLWQRSGRVDRGYAPLKVLFSHLRDVRPWGPADRVRLANVSRALEGMLPGDHSIEIELWYRRSEKDRQKAESEVRALVSRSGGEVTSAAQVPEIGYHGMKCTISLDLLVRLAAGDFDAVAAVKSSAVMYLRVSAQSHSIFQAEPDETDRDIPLPSGEPVLCVLDGVPAANHPLLAGRVVVLDPDDLADDTTAESELRRHGTAMASVAVWGDLSAGDGAASRPVVVRPILTPARDTLGRTEELPPAELAPDLMRRVFREIFGDDSTPGLAPSVVVVNLSVRKPPTWWTPVAWARCYASARAARAAASRNARIPAGRETPSRAST